MDMWWTGEGYDGGTIFEGTFKTRKKEYVGGFSGSIRGGGKLIKGVVAEWDGHTC